jgi:hypothetical protein
MLLLSDYVEYPRFDGISMCIRFLMSRDRISDHKGRCPSETKTDENALQMTGVMMHVS